MIREIGNGIYHCTKTTLIALPNTHCEFTSCKYPFGQRFVNTFSHLQNICSDSNGKPGLMLVITSSQELSAGGHLTTGLFTNRYKNVSADIVFTKIHFSIDLRAIAIAMEYVYAQNRDSHADDCKLSFQRVAIIHWQWPFCIVLMYIT